MNKNNIKKETKSAEKKRGFFARLFNFFGRLISLILLILGYILTGDNDLSILGYIILIIGIYAFYKSFNLSKYTQKISKSVKESTEKHAKEAGIDLANVKLSELKAKKDEDAKKKQIPPTAVKLKKMITQPKSRKYSGYSTLDISNVADEIETFFSNQKFGWLGEAKPTVIVSKVEKSAVIRCYTAKTLVRTWGNSKETAINVTIENNNGTIEYNCGFTGNKAVLSGESIAGAVLTGGGSLIGNAASAIKDGKLVNSTMEFIDDMMKNQFRNNSVNQTIVKQEIDIADQIRKLSDLKNDGIISEDEFNIKKSELLKK